MQGSFTIIVIIITNHAPPVKGLFFLFWGEKKRDGALALEQHRPSDVFCLFLALVDVIHKSCKIFLCGNEDGTRLTRELAGKVYEERSVQLGDTWEFAFRVAVMENGESCKVPLGVDTPAGTVLSFTVWGTERECP